MRGAIDMSSFPVDAGTDGRRAKNFRLSHWVILGGPTMSKRTRKRSRRHAAAESRPADVATIGWMLTGFTAMVCELGFAVTPWVRAAKPDGPLDVLSRLPLFPAVAVGLTPVPR